MDYNIKIRKRLKGWDIKRAGWFMLTGGVCFSLWGLVMSAFRFFEIIDVGVIAAFSSVVL